MRCYRTRLHHLSQQVVFIRDHGAAKPLFKVFLLGLLWIIPNLSANTSRSGLAANLEQKKPLRNRSG